MEDQAREEDLCKEAEEFVISIAILDPSMIDRMAAVIGPKSFFDLTLGKVWALITDLKNSGTGVTMSKIVSECAKRGLIKDLGGAAAFAQLCSRAPNAAHADYYSLEVVRYSELRRMRMAALILLEQLKDAGAEPDRALQAFTAKVEGVGSSKDGGFVSLGETIRKVAKHYQSYRDVEATPSDFCIPTGFPAFDEVTGGLDPGNLYLLGGRTGMGKTALALNIAQRAAASGKVVWFCSLEMAADELAQRLVTSNVDVSSRSWKRGLDEGQIACLVDWNERIASKLPFWITDKSESFQTLKAKSRLRKSLDGLDLLIVDNLQLIRPFDYRAPKHERLKSLTEAFKNQFAKELGVAVLMLCQLSVDAEPGKDEKEPDNTSWADSKRIVDDADVAVILHRPKSGPPKLIMTKNRAGELRNIQLQWIPEKQRFQE